VHRKAWLDMLRDIPETIPMQERRIDLALLNFDGLIQGYDGQKLTFNMYEAYANLRNGQPSCLMSMPRHDRSMLLRVLFRDMHLEWRDESEALRLSVILPVIEATTLVVIMLHPKARVDEHCARSVITVSAFLSAKAS
jgi:hypothetical protein